MDTQLAPVVEDFSLRTQEGAVALVRSLAAMQSSPFRTAYVATAAVNVSAELVGAQKVAQVANTALLPLLALSKPLTADSVVFAIAGAVGQWEKAQDPQNPKVGGVISTITPHVGYLADIAKRTKLSITPQVAGIYAGVWGAGTLLAAAASRQHLGAVALGGAVVSTVAAAAQDPRLRATVSTQGVSHGANLVLASEGITFAKNLLSPKAKFLKRLANSGEAALFATGHMLLSDGLRG